MDSKGGGSDEGASSLGSQMSGKVALFVWPKDPPEDFTLSGFLCGVFLAVLHALKFLRCAVIHDSIKKKKTKNTTKKAEMK